MPFGVCDLEGNVINSPFLWATSSDLFFHAAIQLEALCKNGEAKYWELIKKQRREKGVDGWIDINYSTDLEEAVRNKDLKFVYPYLYLHALELSIKRILLIYVGEKNLLMRS